MGKIYNLTNCGYEEEFLQKELKIFDSKMNGLRYELIINQTINEYVIFNDQDRND